MQIITAEEMGAADRRSVEQGISLRTLMENAGAAVARFVLRRASDTRLVAVLCGRGNNGGDGMVAAAHLAAAGVAVRLVLLGSAGDLTELVRQVYERAAEASLEAHEVTDEAGLRACLTTATLVLDAVVGTGFKPPLRGLAATARDVLASLATPVVAVDLPSGWDADSQAMRSTRDLDSGRDEAFRADAVVTFTAPKPAHIFGHMTPGDVFGPVVLADIGTPAAAISSTAAMYWAGSSKALAEKRRDPDGNKGKFGHLLLVGGSFGKSGAAAMMSLAALRTGAGLVTAAVPRSILPEVARIAPELMTRPLQELQDGSGLDLDLLQPESLAELLSKISAVGIGPGLGQESSTVQFVREFVRRVSLPMVIDADALNALANETALLKEATATKDQSGSPRTIVLTPHPGEMARLIGKTVKEVEADRVSIAREFAKDHGVILVLKGWRTLIAHPSGEVAVNTTGNPSMAKGGSGDILTGIVAAMIAQYPGQIGKAVEAAVFLHGLAGDFACLDQDEHTVLATDTVQHLARAFRGRVQDEDGFTWIAGTAANGSDQAILSGKGFR